MCCCSLKELIKGKERWKREAGERGGEAVGAGSSAEINREEEGGRKAGEERREENRAAASEAGWRGAGREGRN